MQVGYVEYYLPDSAPSQAVNGESKKLHYSVSKGALMTITRNLGDTLMREDGVRVNQINPGWTLIEAEQKRKLEEGLGD